MILNESFVRKALSLIAGPGSAQSTVNNPAEPYSAVVTDSRKISKNCLFVALPGDKFDGHDFIPAAVSQGASGVICRADYKASPSNTTTFFKVADTVDAYRSLGSAWRKGFQIPLVAVAGSVGKTTTKELLAALLAGKWKGVLKTQGSQNGFIGIPMTLLELKKEHDVAVIEVGIDEIGAMEKHMSLIDATSAVLTAIGPEHLEKLVDVPTVAREESIALTHVARAGGMISILIDDPWIAPLDKSITTERKQKFTLEAGAKPSATMLVGKLASAGTHLDISGLGLEPFTVELPLQGAHNATNLLGAVAVARGLGLSAKEIREGLKTFRGATGRSELRSLGDQTPVVCDYYNANPTSVEAGLDLLTQVAKKSVRWACLADMLELGVNEEKFHRDLSQKLIALQIENVLLYGPRMKWLESELKSRAFAGTVSHFESHQLLADKLIASYHPGDAILIKGSRGMKMEEVWKILEKARSLLPPPRL